MGEKLEYLNKGTLSICCEMRLREDMTSYQAELIEQQSKPIKTERKKALSDFL